MTDQEKAEDLARIGRLYERIQKKKLFGKVTLSLQNGKLTDVRIEEVQKPTEL